MSYPCISIDEFNCSDFDDIDECGAFSSLCNFENGECIAWNSSSIKSCSEIDNFYTCFGAYNLGYSLFFFFFDVENNFFFFLLLIDYLANGRVEV
jgi:hypothetical protein